MKQILIVLIQLLIFSSFISCKKSLDGTVVTFFENGDTATIYNFKNNVLDGTFKEFYDDGTLKVKGIYKNGLQNGIYEIYFPSGWLSKYYFFQNDTLLYAKRFTEEGKLIDWVIGFRKTNDMFRSQLYFGEPLQIGYTLPFSMADAYLSIVIIDLAVIRGDTLATYCSQSESISYEFKNYRVGSNIIEVTVCEIDKMTDFLLGCQKDTLRFEVFPR